jgi:alpha-D-ribose 1-methylphosphonate 5-triphosphate synthase subunit PhnH
MLGIHASGGGFGDPVFQSQAVFRAVMDAMARPGSVHAISSEGLLPPAPLSPGAAAVALTLCDHDTPIWLEPRLAAAEAVPAWLTFHTGAKVTSDPRAAAFALISDAAALPDFGCFALGTDEYPDRSTTLIVQVEELSGGEPMELHGPGIAGSRRFAPNRLPADIRTRWQGNRELFPRGVDLILCAPHQLAALPRSTRIQPKAPN